MRLTTQFSALPVRKMFKEKKNKTSTKTDPAFVSHHYSFYRADYQIFCGLLLLKYTYGYEILWYLVFHRFLKVAVIGKVSSGLMKTVAVTKKSVEIIWTHPHGVVLALPIKFSFLLLCIVTVVELRSLSYNSQF